MKNASLDLPDAAYLDLRWRISPAVMPWDLLYIISLDWFLGLSTWHYISG
jgi:hypothetical protein